MFYWPGWTKRGTTWKWILTIFKYKNECYKQIEQKFVYFSSFFPELCFLNCPKKSVFYNFVMTSARKLSLLKQFTYCIWLKVIITLFQKMIWFLEVWATIHDILEFKISKKILTQQKFNKIIQIQTLISPKHKAIA